MREITEKRTRNSKTTGLGGRKFAWDGTIGAIHYEDGGWQEIDNIFEPAVAPWDWEMLHAGYHIRVKEDFTAGQIIEFEKQGETVQFQPMALEWTNDLDQIQPVAMPHDVTPAITNPEVDLLPAVGVPCHQGTIRWGDAYGQGIDFEWKCSSTRLQKVIEIESLAKLPVPQQYILDGGNPVLRFNLIFDPSKDVDIYVDGAVWNERTTKQTFNVIEFRKDGEVLWGFLPLRYWGSYIGEDEELEEANQAQSIATLEKSGNKLYISIRVPYDWIQAAVYPIFIDTDVDEQISNTDDDRYSSDDAWFADATYVQCRAHTDFDDTRDAGLRFLGVNIPNGATIGANSYLSLYVYSSTYDNANLNIHCEDVEAPLTMKQEAIPRDRNLTTASLLWIENGVTTGGFLDTASLQDPIQEIVTDYTCTNMAFMFIGKDTLYRNLNWYDQSYDNNTYGAKLHIEYEAGAAGWGGEFCGVAVEEFDGVTPDEIDGV